jgi:antitoxin HigA-1
MLTMSKSSTIIDADWLDLPHAGEILLSEFMEPLGVSPAILAAALLVDERRVADTVSGHLPIDADMDLRLTRYFRLSEGYFLSIKARLDTLAAKRALNGELSRIMPRAA